MPYVLGCLGVIISFILMLRSLIFGDFYIMLFFLILMFISLIAGVIFGDKSRRNFALEIKQLLENKINQLDMNVSQYFIADDGESAIAIDEENNKIGIIVNNNNNPTVLDPTFNNYNFTSRIFDFRDILKSEILKDGKSITSTSITSTVSGAVLGGMIAGGVGAIIGGMAGEKETVNVVSRLELQVVVNDPKKSVYRIVFAANTERFTIHQLSSKELDEIAHHWHNLLSHIIKLNDSEIKNNISNFNKIDELKKLGELLNEGFITQEEFEIEKQKLLNN